MTKKSGFQQFKLYAITNGIHDGPATLAALETIYNEHKGSHYKTITDLFLAQSRIIKLTDPEWIKA
jgi:hypothetical protein